MSLDRFVAAQSDGIFEAALDEIVSGRKAGHWIWFIFPQIEGLGSSGMASRYAIANLDEAAEYLQHPVLGPRLKEVAEALAVHLRSGVALRRIMASQVDALKLVSSMTLFERAAAAVGQGAAGFRTVANEILSIAELQGFARCQFTLRQVASDVGS